MKKIFLTTLSVLALGVSNTYAAESSTTGKAHATLLEPTTIKEEVQMQFGNMLKGNHTVEIDTAGNRNGQAQYLIGGIEPKPGEFLIEGTENQAITIKGPESFEVKDGTNTMTVDNIKMKLNDGGDQNGGQNFTGTIKDDGTAKLVVGGTLNVTDQTPEGVYEGTYDVIVNY
ncbi:MAG: DUF4402 domain-containing protein [Alphaproteobacteria bacterium]|nr:DUF4402 domain-containing protein [Alphaproteobacteria bacterium]